VRVCADCGVDGVKVDVQGTVGLMGSKLGGGPDMTRKYHQSLERSVQAAFPGNHCINCMCHSTENLYRCDLLSVYGKHDPAFSSEKASQDWVGLCTMIAHGLHANACKPCISVLYVIVANHIFSAEKACGSILAQATPVQSSISFGVPCFWANC
jgi:hypothetical protein